MTKYRKPEAGRKQKAPDVQLGVFDWFLDVRGTLKGRLPRKLLLFIYLFIQTHKWFNYNMGKKMLHDVQMKSK